MLLSKQLPLRDILCVMLCSFKAFGILSFGIAIFDLNEVLVLRPTSVWQTIPATFPVFEQSSDLMKSNSLLFRGCAELISVIDIPCHCIPQTR